MAELVLIHSWTSHQKYIYHLFRKVKNMLQINCNCATLSTYNFKTLMLWESEKHDPGFWDAVSTSAALEMLLMRMVEWLEDIRCPNYFIPGNNMWDHLPRVDSQSCFHAEMVWLTEFLNSGIYDLIDMDLKFCPNCKMFGQFQETFLPLLNCVLNTNKFRSKSEQHISEKAMHILLKKELHHLIRGLTFQIISMHLTRDENSNRRCETILHLAEESFRNSMASRNEEFLPMDNVLLKQMPSEIIDVWCNSVLVNAGKDCKDPSTYGKSENYRRKSIEWPVHDCSCTTTTAIKYLGEITFVIASSFPKLSYFTSAVFRANFYYRNSHFQLAVDVCDEALEVFHGIFGLEFYHYAVPVLISEEWSVVFDEHIRTIIGFYVLVKNILHLNISVLDEICPHLFLLYLKIRCAQSMLLPNATLNEFSKDMKKLFYDNYNACFHEKFCRLNRSQTLICALWLSGIR